MPPKRKRKKKSSKRVARGKKLARSLPRDKKGKFLPRGSKNLFVKRKFKRRRSQGSLRKPKRKKQVRRAKLTRRKSLPSMSRRGLGTDKFPNFLSGTLTESSADTFTTTQVFTPIPRLKVSGNRATVLELLWMEWQVNNLILNAGNESITFQMVIGTVPSSILALNDPRYIAGKRIEMHLLTSGAWGTIQPWRTEFQSRDGFGYLLASDAFHINVNGTGTGVANVVQWRLYYRFVNIPLAEFIGIVQSTQQS